MNAELNKEVQDAIKKNLPAQVCEEVRLALDENVALRTKNTELNKKNNQLNDDLAKHRELEGREETCRQRELEIVDMIRKQEKAQMEQELILAKKDIECQKTIVNNAMELMRNLTKNVVYKKSMTGNAAGQDANGYITTVPINEDTETKPELDNTP